jgi:hypothetical protein
MTVCLLIAFFALFAFTVFKIKSIEEFQQKVVLAHELHKVLEHLTYDLIEARKNTVLDVPVDGIWHDHIAFIHARQGAMEYLIKEGGLFRVNNGKRSLIADDIADLRIRRQKETPDILEIQVKAQKNVSLTYNLRIRMFNN